MNEIKKMIETLQGHPTRSRAQVVHHRLIVNTMTREDHNPFDNSEDIRKVLDALVAEAYMAGRSSAIDEIQKGIFDLRASAPDYDMGTFGSVNDYLKEDAE